MDQDKTVQESLEYLLETDKLPCPPGEFLSRLRGLVADPVTLYLFRDSECRIRDYVRLILNTIPKDDGEVRVREQAVGEVRGLQYIPQLANILIQTLTEKLTNEQRNSSTSGNPFNADSE